MYRFGVKFLLLLALTGCGDKTQEQYNRKKVDEEFAKILPIVGSYLGPVNIDGIEIAKMTLILNADKKISGGTDSPILSQQTIITGTVTFDGKVSASISFTNGVYDPDQKKFQLQLPIQKKNGQTVNLDLSGKFDGETIKGRVLIKEYPQSGGEFVLSESNEISKPSLERTIEALPEDPAPLHWIAAAGHKPDRIDLFLMAQFLSDEDKVVNLFSSSKIFSGSINFASVVRATFTEAVWDTRLGTLRADGIIGSEEHGDQKISLNCVSFLTSQKALGWSCTYMNLSGGVYFPIKFFPG